MIIEKLSLDGGATASILENETPKRDIFKVPELSIIRSVNQVTCKTSFYIIVFESSRAATRGLRSATLLKKRLWHRCFPANFA